MRLSKTVDLGDGRFALLKEATVAQMRNALMQFKTGKFADMPVMELLTGHTVEIIGLLDDCITLHGCNWEDLTYSEIMQIWDGAKGLLPFLAEIEKVIRGLIAAYPSLLLSNISNQTQSV